MRRTFRRASRRWSTKIRESWNGPQAPAVRLLPAELPYDALKADEYTNKWHIPIGIAESNLKPVYLELDNDPHFMYLSDVETGKSNFLRVLIKTIVSRCTSKEAQFVLFDYRRSLLGAVPPNYLVKHCSTSEQSMEMVKALIAAAKSRAAPDDVTPQQLRDRSWWSGPEMFAIIDDFDLVSSGFQNPLQPLMEVVPQGRDTGLHVIITRRTGGAGRDLYGQVLGRMKDLATPGFQGSGPRAEGKLLGDIKASEDASRPRLACGPSPRKPQDPGRLDTTGDLAWTGVPSYRRPRRRIRFHSLEDQQTCQRRSIHRLLLDWGAEPRHRRPNRDAPKGTVVRPWPSITPASCWNCACPRRWSRGEATR